MPSTKKRSSVTLGQVIALAIAGLASLSGMAWLITDAVDKVKSGRGLETHRTFWLVEDNAIGFLVFMGALAIAFIVGGVLRLREYLQWRDLEKKYGSDVEPRT